MSEITNSIASKPVKLTKSGKVDKRGESSAKNLEKGKSIIKEALKQAKEKQNKPKLEIIYSSDEYSTDDEEIILKPTTQINRSLESEKKINQPLHFVPKGLSPRRSTDSGMSSIPKLERQETEDIKIGNHAKQSIPEDYSFTFEKKLEDKIKALDDMYNQKLSLIENDTKLTRAELNSIKAQNQALKKSMTNSFRTHAGIINEEMYLKF